MPTDQRRPLPPYLLKHLGELDGVLKLFAGIGEEWRPHLRTDGCRTTTRSWALSSPHSPDPPRTTGSPGPSAIPCAGMGGEAWSVQLSLARGAASYRVNRLPMHEGHGVRSSTSCSTFHKLAQLRHQRGRAAAGHHTHVLRAPRAVL